LTSSTSGTIALSITVPCRGQGTPHPRPAVYSRAHGHSDLCDRHRHRGEDQGGRQDHHRPQQLYGYGHAGLLLSTWHRGKTCTGPWAITNDHIDEPGPPR